MNESVDNPEAQRAARKADGPGIGTTGMFLCAHNLAWMEQEENSVFSRV